MKSKEILNAINEELNYVDFGKKGRHILNVFTKDNEYYVELVTFPYYDRIGMKVYDKSGEIIARDWLCGCYDDTAADLIDLNLNRGEVINEIRYFPNDLFDYLFKD